MKRFSILHSVLWFILMLEVTCIAQHSHTKYCGEIMNQTSSSSSSILNNMTLCRSHNLYFRTSLGLFKVTSIDYNTRTLTISHSSSSSSLRFVSPLAVTAVFPSPKSDSFLLFNCSIKRRNRNPILPLLHKFCRELYLSRPHECLVVKDLHKMDNGFDPRHLNCLSYMWVHKSSSNVINYGGYKLGTMISFHVIPDHVPDLCKECEKPHGNCGAGLKCLCHAKECKDEILFSGALISSISNMFISLLSIISVLVFVIEI